MITNAITRGEYFVAKRAIDDWNSSWSSASFEKKIQKSEKLRSEKVIFDQKSWKKRKLKYLDF